MGTAIVLADDFTGSGDSGVHFARAGNRTALLLELDDLERELPAYEALCLSTESRFLEKDEAAKAVRGLAARCVAAGGDIVFKKVDSTLRGNLGAEIEAVLDVAGYRAALVCTAMPKTGRTCAGGCLFLNGVPLHETEIGRDPFNPVSTSVVAEVVAGQTELATDTLGLDAVRSGLEALRARVLDMLDAGCRIIVADAETDADLAALGNLLREARKGGDGLPSLLAVGAGGLAEAFTGAAGTTPPEPRGRLLAVMGSLTGVSREQADLAAASGLFFPLLLDMDAGLADPEGECARLAREATEAGDKHLLLRAKHGTGQSRPNTEQGTRAAALFGKAAKALCEAVPCDMLFATGGSTAVAVAASLGIGAIRLESECMPGIVLGTCASGAGITWFISKAGGFGSPQTLCALGERFAVNGKRGMA